MVPTVPNHFVPALVSLALRFQLQPEKLFRRAGIDLTAARARGAGFSVQEVERLVEAFIRDTELPDLALLLGEHVDPENLGLFGQLVTTSVTSREAVATFSDFKWLLHPSFDLRLEHEGALAVVRFASHDDTPIGDKPYYAEALLGAVASLGKHFVGDRATPRRAMFRHAPPSYVATYERIFRCPLAFEQPYDALFYPESLLDRPLLGAASAYHRMLRAQAEGDLRDVQSLPLTQARRVLHARIADSDLDVGDVARVLGVSARTLQRRLAEAGKSFRELRDEVRYQRACERLSMGDDSIDVVASALGYRERANFVRAFTRWSGQSPSRFRGTLRASGRSRTSRTVPRRS